MYFIYSFLQICLHFPDFLFLLLVFSTCSQQLLHDNRSMIEHVQGATFRHAEVSPRQHAEKRMPFARIRSPRTTEEERMARRPASPASPRGQAERRVPNLFHTSSQPVDDTVVERLRVAASDMAGKKQRSESRLARSFDVHLRKGYARPSSPHHRAAQREKFPVLRERPGPLHIPQEVTTQGDVRYYPSVLNLAALADGTANKQRPPTTSDEDEPDLLHRNARDKKIRSPRSPRFQSSPPRQRSNKRTNVNSGDTKEASYTHPVSRPPPLLLSESSDDDGGDRNQSIEQRILRGVRSPPMR